MIFCVFGLVENARDRISAQLVHALEGQLKRLRNLNVLFGQVAF